MERLVTIVHVIPITMGPKTVPRRATRFDAVLAAAIISRPTPIIRVIVGLEKRPIPIPTSKRRQARSIQEVVEETTSERARLPMSSSPDPASMNGLV